MIKEEVLDVIYNQQDCIAFFGGEIHSDRVIGLLTQIAKLVAGIENNNGKETKSRRNKKMA